MPADTGEPLVRLAGLETTFQDRPGLLTRLGVRPEPPVVHAVDGVDLNVRSGEVVGLVGESGSGKTTLARTLLRLTKQSGGEVHFGGHDLSRISKGDWRRLRRDMQMVFQDPHASLSPRQRVHQLLHEPYEIHGVPKQERESVTALLEAVRLPAHAARKYPHELSGGQARRVGIARALVLGPRLIVADEPTSGLDVSAAASVLNLLKALTVERALACIVITHNLAVLGAIADRIAVMYLGRIVEQGPRDLVLDHPAHPYTRALLAAVGDELGATGKTDTLVVGGELPSARRPPTGCHFHTRCPFAEQRCAEESPPLREVGGEHVSACHFAEAIQDGTRLPRVETDQVA